MLIRGYLFIYFLYKSKSQMENGRMSFIKISLIVHAPRMHETFFFGFSVIIFYSTQFEV